MTRPSMSPGFDQRIADWLEDDPDHAPEPVLSTVLAAFPSIPQRRAWRVPWRTRPVTTMASRLLAGAALAVVLVGGLFILRTGGPGVAASAPPPSPSAPPASPAAALVLEKTFVSDRFGYSVDYPINWTTVQSSLPWERGTVNLWSSGINDEVKGTDIRFSGAAQTLAQGQTPAEWLFAYGSPVTALGGNGGDPATWPKVAIDGLDGMIDVDGGPADGGMVASGGRMFDAVVISGNVAYNFNMDGNVDRGTFLAFLATVKLPVIPALDASFTSTINGISIRYPSSWRVTPATVAWPPGTEAAVPPDPTLDMFTPGTQPSRFVIVSSPLARGVTPDAWLVAYEKSAPQMPAACWPAPDQMERITIDGQPAWIHGGLAACGFTEAVTFAGGRVYELTGYDRGSLEIDHDLFLALLGTVKLDPASADHASPPHLPSTAP